MQHQVWHDKRRANVSFAALTYNDVIPKWIQCLTGDFTQGTCTANQPLISKRSLCVLETKCLNKDL